MPEKKAAEEAAGVTLQLETPIKIAEGMVITELRFPARLRGIHLRRYAAGDRGVIDADTSMKVAADSCGQPDKVFDEMDGRDVAKVLELMTGFFVKAGFLRIIAAS